MPFQWSISGRKNTSSIRKTYNTITNLNGNKLHVLYAIKVLEVKLPIEYNIFSIVVNELLKYHVVSVRTCAF